MTFHYVVKNAPVDNLLNQEKSLSVNRYTLIALAKLTLLRCLPNYFKQNFIIESAELWRQEEISSEIQPYSENNYIFYSQLQKGLNLNDKNNSFRWYHINGAHFPFDMTRDIKPVQKGERTTRYEKSVGALKIALTYLQQLKDLGIYDNATILILSDHGDHQRLFEDIKTFSEIKPLPLVLVKQPNEHGILKISENPVSYLQLQATILKRFPEGAEFGEDFSMVSIKERFFRLVNYTSDHKITEYIVARQAQVNSSWHEVKNLYRKYADGDQAYRLGTVLTSKNVELYLTSGWKMWPDINFFLTDAEKAEMLFHIKNFKRNKDLKLKFSACGLFKTNIKKVDLYVNDIFVATLEMDRINKTYTVTIPNKLLDGDKLELNFIINDYILHDAISFFNLVIE